MTHKRLVLSILSMALLIFLLFGCSSIAAEMTPTPDLSIVWTEDFDDGDLSGWEIFTPRDVFYVEEGVLMSGPETGGDILHESNVSTGTWSFDIYLPEKMSGVDLFGLVVDQAMNNAFGFDIKNTLENTQIRVATLEDTQFEYKSQILVPKAVGWNHMDITRDEIGNSKFYLNSELILEYTDDLTISPYYLYFTPEILGPTIDNVVVRNQVMDIQAAE
jgi:hypothetical protein